MSSLHGVSSSLGKSRCHVQTASSVRGLDYAITAPQLLHRSPPPPSAAAAGASTSRQSVYSSSNMATTQSYGGGGGGQLSTVTSSIASSGGGGVASVSASSASKVDTGTIHSPIHRRLSDALPLLHSAESSHSSQSTAGQAAAVVKVNTATAAEGQTTSSKVTSVVGKIFRSPLVSGRSSLVANSAKSPQT